MAVLQAGGCAHILPAAGRADKPLTDRAVSKASPAREACRLESLREPRQPQVAAQRFRCPTHRAVWVLRLQAGSSALPRPRLARVAAADGGRG